MEEEDPHQATLEKAGDYTQESSSEEKAGEAGIARPAYASARKCRLMNLISRFSY